MRGKNNLFTKLREIPRKGPKKLGTNNPQKPDSNTGALKPPPKIEEIKTPGY